MKEEFNKGMMSVVGSTERIRRLNKRLHGTSQTICLHRARAYTSVYAETEGEPLSLRRAKALQRTLDELPIEIGDDELLVGRHACRIRSVPIVPECHGGWLQWDLENLPGRAQDPFEIPPDQMAEAKQILEVWKGKTLYDLWAGACPSGLVRKTVGAGWADICAGVFFIGYHFTPPWEKLLSSGLVTFEADIRNRLNLLSDINVHDFCKEHFLQAALIVIEAIKSFAERYAEKAEILTKRETDPMRRQELELIAATCRKVPYHGASSFYEAMQSLWFIHTLLHIEGTGPVYTIGRLDQYMYPFYSNDLESGRTTPEAAQELLEHLYINMTNILFLYDTQTAQGSAGFTQYQTLSLGGVDEHEKDSSNALSYLCLDAAAAVRTTQPDIALLCHPRETPYQLKMKAAEMVQSGLGMPKFFNTETLKAQLMELGYTREAAGLGWVQGCSEPYGPGSQQAGHTAGIMINLPLALEMVLFRGIKQTSGQPCSGEMIGIDTGDPENHKSFEEFLGAYKRQVAHQIKDGFIAGAYMEKVQAQNFPIIFQSILTNSCIDRCLSANAGGAKINTGPGIAFTGGWGTVADSLAAIKRFVYEEKKLSMAELARMIKANFEGYEHWRLTLINKSPKFGNDNDYVDDIARDIFHFATDEVKKYICLFENRAVPATNVSVSYIIFGTFVGATPDGRFAGTAFSDNISPNDQRDIEGPVAHINSVTKLGLERQMGTIHNMYLVNAGGEENRHLIIDLVDTYHARGGHHLQINCIDKKVLIDAQQQPEKYPTLMIRVAGYVAYFIDLSPMVQNYIIERTSVNF